VQSKSGTYEKSFLSRLTNCGCVRPYVVNNVISLAVFTIEELLTEVKIIQRT
jgi:hypothetical protein